MSHEAIYNKYATVVEIRGDGVPRDSNGNEVTIDDAVVATEDARIDAAHNALEYSRLRKAKYDLLNQDEMRYDDVKNSTTTWVDAIDAIKAAHPKP